MSILLRYYCEVAFELFIAHIAIYVQEANDSERRERDRQERMVASLREREMVVKQSLSVSLRERDREREQHQKEEAVQHFKALMADMVNIICIDILCYAFYLHILLLWKTLQSESTESKKRITHMLFID